MATIETGRREDQPWLVVMLALIGSCALSTSPTQCVPPKKYADFIGCQGCKGSAGSCCHWTSWYEHHVPEGYCHCVPQADCDQCCGSSCCVAGEECCGSACHNATSGTCCGGVEWCEKAKGQYCAPTFEPGPSHPVLKPVHKYGGDMPFPLEMCRTLSPPPPDAPPLPPSPPSSPPLPPMSPPVAFLETVEGHIILIAGGCTLLLLLLVICRLWCRARRLREAREWQAAHIPHQYIDGHRVDTTGAHGQAVTLNEKLLPAAAVVPAAVLGAAGTQDMGGTQDI